jgi:ribose 5-phosphate isomerase B
MSKALNIGIGSDHRGYKLKDKLRLFLVMQGCEVNDFGVFSQDRADYPLVAFKLGQSMKTTDRPKPPKIDMGILICGSGIGMSIAANKVKGIRAALCLTPEFAKRARNHNNANILVLAADFITEPKAQEIVRVFLTEKFLGERYQTRVRQIRNFEA